MKRWRRGREGSAAAPTATWTARPTRCWEETVGAAEIGDAGNKSDENENFISWFMRVGKIAWGARCLPPTEGNSNYFLNLLLWEQKKIESSNCNFAISAFILNQIVIIWNRWTLEWSKRESRDERCLQLFEHKFVILFIRWKCPNWLVTTFSEVGAWWIPRPLCLP